MTDEELRIKCLEMTASTIDAMRYYNFITGRRDKELNHDIELENKDNKYKNSLVVPDLVNGEFPDDPNYIRLKHPTENSFTLRVGNKDYYINIMNGKFQHLDEVSDILIIR